MTSAQTLVDLMDKMFHRFSRSGLDHYVFSSDDVKLESWLLQGGLQPPCIVFQISVLSNSKPILGMLVYYTLREPYPSLRIDSAMFSPSSKNPLRDKDINEYKFPKRYLVSDPFNKFNSVDLNDYGFLRIEGGWDYVMDKLSEFI